MTTYRTHLIAVYLDDERTPPKGFYDPKTVKECWSVKTVDECWELLCTYNVDTCSLDNDLGVPGLENEGREIIKRLITAQERDGLLMWPRKLILHSANPVAVQYMISNLSQYAPMTPQGADKLVWTYPRFM